MTSSFQTAQALPSLPADWGWRTLQQLVDPNRGICYGIVQPGGHSPNGIPMVNSGDVLNGRVNSKVTFRVARDLHQKFGRSTLRGGEVLVTLVGVNFGQVAVAPDHYAGHNCARPVGVVPVLADSHFVMYALQSPLLRQCMDNVANTTAQPTLNLKDLGALPIPLPPPATRLSIVILLRSLDDRITLLRETNATLEAIAQALFKSWFVDFDPVRAKMEGRAPDGMDEATAALFPDSLEETELGWVPKGWQLQSLDSIADYLNGLALQKFPPTGVDDLPVIKIAQLRKGDTTGADLASRGIKPEYVVKNGDVLFSWSGSLEVDIWCGGEGALNQHLFKVTSKQYPTWFYYLWTKQHLAQFRQIAASKATTMGHIQRGHLSSAMACVPSPSVLAVADDVIAPLVNRIVENNLQARALAETRDTLLPRLISGELRLPEVAAEVAA